jgi:hypothetical protein
MGHPLTGQVSTGILEVPGSDPGRERKISWPKFVFLTPSKQLTRYFLDCHYRFLLNSFQFIVHLPYNSTLHSQATRSFVKYAAIL